MNNFHKLLDGTALSSSDKQKLLYGFANGIRKSELDNIMIKNNLPPNERSQIEAQFGIKNTNNYPIQSPYNQQTQQNKYSQVTHNNANLIKNLKNASQNDPNKKTQEYIGLSFVYLNDHNLERRLERDINTYNTPNYRQFLLSVIANVPYIDTNQAINIVRNIINNNKTPNNEEYIKLLDKIENTNSFQFNYTIGSNLPILFPTPIIKKPITTIPIPSQQVTTQTQPVQQVKKQASLPPQPSQTTTKQETIQTVPMSQQIAQQFVQDDDDDDPSTQSQTEDCIQKYFMKDVSKIGTINKEIHDAIEKFINEMSDMENDFRLIRILHDNSVPTVSINNKSCVFDINFASSLIIFDGTDIEDQLYANIVTLIQPYKNLYDMIVWNDSELIQNKEGSTFNYNNLTDNGKQIFLDEINKLYNDFVLKYKCFDLLLITYDKDNDKYSFVTYFDDDKNPKVTKIDDFYINIENIGIVVNPCLFSESSIPVTVLNPIITKNDPQKCIDDYVKLNQSIVYKKEYDKDKAQDIPIFVRKTKIFEDSLQSIDLQLSLGTLQIKTIISSLFDIFNIMLLSDKFKDEKNKLVNNIVELVKPYPNFYNTLMNNRGEDIADKQSLIDDLKKIYRDFIVKYKTFNLCLIGYKKGYIVIVSKFEIDTQVAQGDDDIIVMSKDDYTFINPCLIENLTMAQTGGTYRKYLKYKAKYYAQIDANVMKLIFRN